jgi:hypothetical protein
MRKFFYAYELGVRRDVDARPLRMGSAFHLGVDRRCQGDVQDNAILHAVSSYDSVPDWAQTEEQITEWFVEREKVARLLSGYFWRWECEEHQPLGLFDGGPLEVVATELSFDLPIRNPKTQATTPSFRLAGKIDKVVRLADGRLAVMEHKTTGDDLAPESDYWKRLRIDQQISLYFCAARELGYDVQTVLYDVIRKPTIDPLSIPLLDVEGMKIVLDAQGERVRTKDGKKWRESADAAQGYTLQSRRQTPLEYGERLTLDIATRPDFYFRRVEIPRLISDLIEWQEELWDIQQTLRAAQREERWFRNTSACLGMSACSYLSICHQGVDLSQGVPAGFVVVVDKHPELTA